MLRDLRPVGPPRARAGFFGKKKGNRRVRVASGSVPVLPRPPRSPIWGRMAVCALIGGGVVGAGVALRDAVLHGRRFALAQIEVSPLRRLERDAVLRRSGLVAGQSLFQLDLAEAERRISREPWVAGVKVRRQLPHTISIEVTERDAKIAVQLGSVYLADETGALFKRATRDEATRLPLITGVARSRYLSDPGRARAVVRRAIALDRAWQASGRAAPLELHHEGGYDAAALFTVFFEQGGRRIGARLGVADATTPDRLKRLDEVLHALDVEKAKPELVHLEQRSIDRVAVKLADAGANLEKNVTSSSTAAGTAASGI